MMNLEDELIELIDISSANDFLIDSPFDDSSLDLRLSVACETQDELICNLRRTRLQARQKENEAETLSSPNKEEAFYLTRERIKNESSVRKSLAWNCEFFTSPGFLELEELCLVNRGFMNPEATSIRGAQETRRSKICQERSSSRKPVVVTGSKQRTQSFMKPKMVSPSKVISMQDSKPQPLIRRSSAIPRVASRPHIQSPTDRRETLKSTRVSTMHTKKPRPDSWSLSSISSVASSSNSVDLSPYITARSYDAHSANLSKTPVMRKRECPSKSLSPPVDLSRQSGARIAKRSPLSADDIQRSSKPSSLRVPSQKIGFFDMKEASVENSLRSSLPTKGDSTYRLKDLKIKEKEENLETSTKDQRRRGNKHKSPSEKATLRIHEKENIFHPEDTVIELGSKQLVSSSSPLKPGTKKFGQSSSSGGKHLLISQRIPFSLKGSPLKRSAFF